MIEATHEFDGEIRRRRFKTPYGAGKFGFRMVLDIPVTGPINRDLWKALKPPPGWKKNSRQKWKEDACFPVRLVARDPAAMPTPEQIEALRLQILLMVRA